MVYKLLQDRRDIYKMMQTENANENFTDNIMSKTNSIVKEGFTNTIVTAIQNSSSKVNIRSYPFQNMTPQFGITNPDTKQLQQFCIKSSLNSCYDGTNVSLDMLNYVLSRGCRFLDFEIYWGTPTLPDGTEDTGQTSTGAVVSVSDDPTTPATNCLSLYSVLNYIQQNAFSSSICPNFKDPLFVQIRVKYLIHLNEANNQKTLYNSIAKTISDRFATVQYKGKVTGKTPINNIEQQVVVIMDTYANRDYVGVSPSLAKAINMESNSNVLTFTTYEDAITQAENSFPIDKNGIVTNMKIMQQVAPMSTVSSVQYLFSDNFDSMSIISRYSAQFTPMLFYRNDTYLKEYEKMFNKSGTGIMTLSSAMNYSDGQQVIPGVVFP